jgi:hypothetical protein
MQQSIWDAILKNMVDVVEASVWGTCIVGRTAAAMTWFSGSVVQLVSSRPDKL